MRTVTDNKLDEILENHHKWLCGRHGGERADLSGCDLSRANLLEADLREANLRQADLSEANLSRANLLGANLSEANLREANLRQADLLGANLSRANLLGANLLEADISGANLSECDLSGCNLLDVMFSHNSRLIGCTLTNYSMVAFMHEGGLRITCGCHKGMTVEEAREHWAPGRVDKWEVKKPSWGEQRQRMIDFLEAEANALGWITPN